jgi:hypothetical protein
VPGHPDLPVPSGIDPGKPNIARIYDYLLGGTVNYQADRDEVGRILAISPQMRDLARENRAFTARAVRRAVAQSTAQFLDLGAGLPRPPATHETARSVLPGARMAYVDNDPMVLAHSGALFRRTPGIAVLGGDLRDIGTVLAHPGLAQVIDLGQPCCVLLACVLHFMDAGTATQTAAAYAAAAAPGSSMVISCACQQDPEMSARLAVAYTAGTGWNHSEEEIRGFFGDLDLVPPSAVNVDAWRPECPGALGHRAAYVYGGVGERSGLAPRGGGRRGRRAGPALRLIHGHGDTEQLDRRKPGA